MFAKERLYLTADKKKIVGEKDKRAAFLYASIGDEILEKAAKQFGLVDGGLPGKGKSKAETKDPEPDDLTAVKGIGKATAKKLVSAGIDTTAKLAEIDPENPPSIEDLGNQADWAIWTEDAKQRVAANG